MSNDGVARPGLTPARWWHSLGQRGGLARGDIAGGITAAAVLPAIEGSYGLLAFAPLGAEHAPMAFLLGAMTAALATGVSLLAGGRGPLLSGSSAALALLLSTLISWLIADPRFLGADGQVFVPTVLAFTGLAIVMAGVLQIALARLRLGGLVRYVPYTVHAGYMNGVAVLMVATILPYVVGLPTLGDRVTIADIKPGAVLVAAVALWIAVRPPAWSQRVPSYLAGLLIATLLHHLLAASPLGRQLGPLFDAPAFELPEWDTLSVLSTHLGSGLLADMLGPLALFALLAGAMSTLQTALAGSTIDELTRTRRSATRELFAQGVANIAAGAVGALPSAGSTTRSKINIDARGKSRMSRLFFAGGLVAALAIGLPFMHLVPMAAIAGVFAAVAFSLVDDWSRRATVVMWRQSLRWRLPRELASSYGVMLLVAAVTIFVSLALAIVLGFLVAMVLFIRSNIRPPVRRALRGDQRQSRKLRPAGDTALLHEHGKRIALVELDGALFFGTAEAADEAIERLARSADFIVIDFRRVTEVDASGARVLLHAADSLQRAGRQLLIASLPPRDQRTRMLRDMDVHEHLSDAQFLPDADRALEAAEDRLLARLRPAAITDALTLADTRLAAGLDDDELDVLAAHLSARDVPRGEPVFRRGDPPDAMFVALAGQIGIWLSPERRLVSYAPGVVFGELGLLEERPRSADAVADQDARVLELSRTAYEQLAATHPLLVAKLLRNVGLQLSSRVRALTDELRAEDDAH